MDVEQVARTLLERLEPHGFVAVVGGFALVAHGIQRTTFDLDLMVEREHQDDIVEVLEALGYETVHRSENFSSHLHPDRDLGRVDLVYVDAETAATVAGSTRVLPLLGAVRAPIACPEHLIAMKLSAIASDPDRRFGDQVDIARLLELPGVHPETVQPYFEKWGEEALFRQLCNQAGSEEEDSDGDRSAEQPDSAARG
ncbi:MAG: hypothetical protein DWQ36_13625 [Acidobacteria bacterium]|nr:MAG: hypothetical protein DWQ30_20330 [Acidobacteriota bacterium]REK06249.1 MAG: hypothetical protein DWQ36_13625 [Acidobacteriota bacterium]